MNQKITSMRRNKVKLTFSEAINEALKYSMSKDQKVICYGLGTTDPKNIFGTTQNLEKLFGPSRVFDTPCSENALTGISVGAAMAGLKPVVTHQRLDFFLLAMDQLVNSAAKWHYMFGGQSSIPITIRLIVGRGWGQGPTHSQNLQSWFAHIPGLKVVAPSFPEDARDLLVQSIFDPNPVLFIEHRWLHSSLGNVSKKINFKNLEKSKLIRNGKDVTIVSNAYMSVEALKAAKLLKKFYNLDCEVVDLRCIKPIDYLTIKKSVKKTKNLLVLDTSQQTCSIASEIVSRVVMDEKINLSNKPKILTLPEHPEPTSYQLTKYYYKNFKDIILSVFDTLKIKKKIKNEMFKIDSNLSHDQPHKEFLGPF
jgi:pyruvate dehydrogenase E1 component beta subunit